MNNFVFKSKGLLLKFLEEPGGFSFFPSSFFWKNEDSFSVEKKYGDFFSSDYFNLNDFNNKVSLYIHIPFCVKICSYCNCFKRVLNNTQELNLYLTYLEKESKILFSLNNNKKIKINAIFIGGGTPNLLSVEDFQYLNKTIENYFDLTDLEDFLVDGHPNFYSNEKFDCFKNIGIKRVTFAIQTFDKDVLILNNRDFYDLKLFENNIKYLKNIGIKTNIDLLIGLKGQTKEIIKFDIDHLCNLGVDNVSVHYLMSSNNIKYDLDNNYLDLINFAKKYILQISLPTSSSNILEDFYASKKNTTISIGCSSVSNIFGSCIFIKPSLKEYYSMLDEGFLPYKKGLSFGIKEEMIKYIYLNIIYGINVKSFKDIFGVDIYKYFYNEFNFLSRNNVIYLKNNIIYSKMNDLDTYIYFNIFFIEKFRDFDLNNYNVIDLNKFFLENGELIDK